MGFFFFFHITQLNESFSLTIAKSRVKLCAFLTVRLRRRAFLSRAYDGEAFPVHQPVVINSMHLQSTYYLHLQYLQSGAHLESSRRSAAELFSGNIQHVKIVGYFCRRAPSWMLDIIFDRILNVNLSNNLL